MPDDRPAVPQGAPQGTPLQGDLFARPSRLLTVGEVEALFCDRLSCGRTSFYDHYRDFLPFVHTGMRKVRAGEYVPAGLRLREDVARELVRVAEAGYWVDYASGDLLGEKPHLYPPAARRAARLAA